MDGKKIGERLGLGDYFPWGDYKEVIEWQLHELGTSLEEMKTIGVKKFDRESGALYLREGEDMEFPTNTGKIEFYSTDLAHHGFDPMPKYTAHRNHLEAFTGSFMEGHRCILSVVLPTILT